MPIKLETNEYLDVIAGMLTKVRPDGKDLLAEMERRFVFLFPDVTEFEHPVQDIVSPLQSAFG